MSSLLDSLCTPPSLTTLRLNSLMAEHERETGLLKLQKSIEEVKKIFICCLNVIYVCAQCICNYINVL